MSTTAPAASPTASSAPSAGCTTAVPGKNGNVPADACNAYYNYDPSFSSAVAVAVIFGLFSVAHIVLAIIFRKVSQPFCQVDTSNKVTEVRMGPYHGSPLGNRRLHLTRLWCP